MTKEKRKKGFNLGTLALTFAIVSALTWISFFFHFLQYEGQIESDASFLNLIADSFIIFRLPLHELLWKTIEDNEFLFYLTLFMNPMFWSMLIERLLFLVKK